MAPTQHHKSLGERWLAYYARIGYGAKGVIYGSSGLLALLEATDLAPEGKVVGSTGALRTIASQPYGRISATIIAVSLMGYVIWRFLQAFLDPEHSGCDASDILRRISYACSGIVYASIAYSVVEILDSASDKEDRTVEEWAYIVMTKPLGRWLIALGGAVFFGIGCYYFYRAIKAEFRKRFKLHKMSDAAKTIATAAGRIGIAARGIVYVVIGASAMQAAWEFDPEIIKDSEQVLAVFNDNPTDELILGILGVGFIAYGVHMGFQAVYRSIDPL